MLKKILCGVITVICISLLTISGYNYGYSKAKDEGEDIVTKVVYATEKGDVIFTTSDTELMETYGHPENIRFKVFEEPGYEYDWVYNTNTYIGWKLDENGNRIYCSWYGGGLPRR